MGYFFFDESIHQNPGFILGTFVGLKDDPGNLIADALIACGLDPSVDEYKSRALKKDNPKQTQLREMLWEMLFLRAKVAVCIGPTSERDCFGFEALRCLKKVIDSNRIFENNSVFFDQGFFPRSCDSDSLKKEFQLHENTGLYLEQDSRRVRGLQLADLTAHTCSMMLLDTLGLIKKTVKAGENSGYPPDLEVELGFEMWANVRWLFFNGGFPSKFETHEDFIVNVADYGLHIYENCSEQIKQSALDRFGTCYLGCIH